MSINHVIAEKDAERYRNWEKTPSKAACLAFDGPAFRGFDGSSLSQSERQIAQKRVRILSGLYGVLKPFDAMRPYRLEMGAKVKTARGSSLYAFWGEAIAKQLAEDAQVIVNAASQEYWKAVPESALGSARVVTVDFPGPAVYAKTARGLICRFAVQWKCQRPEDLKEFTGTAGHCYTFDPRSSTENRYVFQRSSGGGKPSVQDKVSTAIMKRPSATAPGSAKKARTGA